jgi:hypothetical protein
MGQLVSNTDDVEGDDIAHVDMTIVDGIEYAIGVPSTASGFRMFYIPAGTYRVKGTFPGVNPQHTGTRASLDLFETYGATGGSTSGLRYALWTRSNNSSGHPRAILGVRLGTSDQNVFGSSATIGACGRTTPTRFLRSKARTAASCRSQATGMAPAS